MDNSSTSEVVSPLAQSYAANTGNRSSERTLGERFWRSVKYEEIYLPGHSTVSGLEAALDLRCERYNTWRPHQALGNQTPKHVYRNSPRMGLSSEISEELKKPYEQLAHRRPPRRTAPTSVPTLQTRGDLFATLRGHPSLSFRHTCGEEVWKHLDPVDHLIYGPTSSRHHSLIKLTFGLKTGLSQYSS